MSPDTPPPFLRSEVSDAERGQIEQLLGPLADDNLLRAVRDGRGRQFQRLEFLGDSVLDVVLTVHRWVEPACAACAGDAVHVEASDRYLAEAARRSGVGVWLEWRASHDRVADLVETCIAACWINGRWLQTVPFVASVVHPIHGATATALDEGLAGEPGRAARRVGSAVLELASGDLAFRTLPEADEGALSHARAEVHEAHAIARRAAEIGRVGDVRFPRGDDDTVLSQVEDLVAATLGRSGADAALVLAEQFVSSSH